MKGANMKGKTTFLLLSIFCFVSSAVLAQEMNQDEMMKVWMDYMTPGEVHQQMAKMAGDWKSENKMWQAQGSEPIVSEGSCKMEMVLGGRYLKSTNTGDYMGMPFEGISIEAFDNATKEFSSIWIDNFGTGMMMMKGKWDDATKTLTYTGTMVDPMLKKGVPVREVYTIVDDNKFTLEMFTNGPDGQEFKNMEIVYTRM